MGAFFIVTRACFLVQHWSVVSYRRFPLVTCPGGSLPESSHRMSSSPLPHDDAPPDQDAPDAGELTPSELAVLASLHGVPKAISQREIARRAHLFVGFIKGIIRDLVKRGYVRTCRLNRRSLEYLLTPRGVAQTALRSYRCVLSAVRSYHGVQDSFEKLLERLGSEGVSHFYLRGDGELAEMAASVIAGSGWGEVSRGLPSCIAVVAEDKLVCGSDVKSCKAVVLNVAPTPLKKITCRVIDLVQELEMGRLAAVCAE